MYESSQVCRLFDICICTGSLASVLCLPLIEREKLNVNCGSLKTVSFYFLHFVSLMDFGWYSLQIDYTVPRVNAPTMLVVVKNAFIFSMTMLHWFVYSCTSHDLNLNYTVFLGLLALGKRSWCCYRTCERLSVSCHLSKMWMNRLRYDTRYQLMRLISFTEYEKTH